MIDTTTRAFEIGEKRIDLSALIDDGSAPAQTSYMAVCNLPVMKKIKTRGQQLGAKRTYSVASSLSYTSSSRPCKDLSAVSELQNKKRFRKYAPRNGELATWEPWEL